MVLTESDTTYTPGIKDMVHIAIIIFLHYIVEHHYVNTGSLSRYLEMEKVLQPNLNEQT